MEALHLEPKWLDDAVQIVGHYGQIYERNLGKDSDYKIKRQEGKLLKNGGAVTPDPFM